MSDSNRSLIFPMTAGDLVKSAMIVRVDWYGGRRLQILEVIDVKIEGIPEGAPPAASDVLEIKCRDERDNERTLELRRDTAILITEISRR